MFTLREIAAVTGGQLIDKSRNISTCHPEAVLRPKDLRSGILQAFGLQNDGVVISGISTDSRHIKPGDLFIPLRGERFDGHAFFKEVFLKGAACALTERSIEGNNPLVVVCDALKAMQALARHYRKRFLIPTIAVTGSVGKTTTKECIGVALSQSFRVRVGVGNLNNHIGVPLNLFRLNAADQCAVFELGANHPGEIRRLAEISDPTIGVITGIYPVHLEGFGSLEGIYDAKCELADYLDAKQGTLIANGDDPQLMNRLKKQRFRLITFGFSPGCDYRISNLRSRDDRIQFCVNQQYDFKLKGYGSFNALNALAAIAVAGSLKIELNSLVQTFCALPQIERRFRIERWPGADLLVIDDSYNANPKSFQHAVESFKELAGKRRKIIVIGDMLELGEQSVYYHTNLGKFLSEQQTDVLFGIGPLSSSAVAGFKTNGSFEAFHFETVDEACVSLTACLREGDAVLIKGSHGMELCKVKAYLEERFNIPSSSV